MTELLPLPLTPATTHSPGASGIVKVSFTSLPRSLMRQFFMWQQQQRGPDLRPPWQHTLRRYSKNTLADRRFCLPDILCNTDIQHSEI